MFYAKIFIDLYQICVLFIKYVSFLLLPCFDFNKKMLTNGLRLWYNGNAETVHRFFAASIRGGTYIIKGIYAMKDVDDIAKK